MRSLLTRGRPREGVTPNSCCLTSRVDDFIGALLSERSTSGSPALCSAMTVRCISSAASAAFLGVDLPTYNYNLAPVDIFEQVQVIELSAHR